MWLLAAARPDAAVETDAAQASGVVSDATGAPLPGVAVVVRGPVERTAVTDWEGRFQFDGLPDGVYELTATLDRFRPVTQMMRIAGEAAAPLALTLSVAAFDEVRVTAARTGEVDVAKAPMAVSAVPASDLRREQAQSLADIAGLAPGLTFSQNSDFGQVTIRGIGSNVVFAGTDPSTAVYVDGVYMARPVSLVGDFLDLERIEVLRGPQGTLYGRNAVGGAVNVVTRTPSNQPALTARMVAGGFNTLRAEAMASGPIVRDKVMASAAVLRGVADGFVRDLDHPGHPLGGEDVMAARAKVVVALGRRTDLLVSADVTNQDPTPLTYAKVLAVKPGFQVDNPADLHEVHASTLAEGHDNQYGTAALLTTRLTPATTLTSLTAFRTLDYNVVNDSDITELALTSVDLREHQHQVSEELTVSHRGSSLQWLGGLFLFAEDDRQPTAIRDIAANRTSFLSPRVEADSQAAFGQATLALTRRLSVTGGLRYTRENKHIDNLGEFTSDTEGVLPGGYAYSDAIAYSAWTPKAGLEVRAGTNTLAYVSATRGFKSGGFNFTSPEPGRGFAPEWAWSYEGGLKTTLADGRARLSAAAFHTDYTNLQVQTAIRPGVIDTSNAAAATIRGVEAEGDATVGSVGLGGHLAWLDTRYDDYFAVGVGGVSGDVAGNRLNNAPAWSGRLWLQWSHDLGRAFSLSLRADTRWQSTVYFTPFNDLVQRQGNYGLLGASAELAQGRRWAVSVYGRNLLDADFITGSFGTPLPAFGGRPGRPRELGVQLTVQR